MSKLSASLLASVAMCGSTTDRTSLLLLNAAKKQTRVNLVSAWAPLHSAYAAVHQHTD
jgi:hypothetical protein